jgi:hypothetical protein
LVNTTYGLAGSPSALTSGVWRHGAACPHGVPEESALTTPSGAAAPDWQEGIGHWVEMPPVVAVAFPLESTPSFQTPSSADAPGVYRTGPVAPLAYRLVPPTPVANGWLEGFATDSPVLVWSN